MTDWHTPMITDSLATREPRTETFAGATFEIEYRNPVAISVYSVLTRRKGRTTYVTTVRSNGSTWGGEAPKPLSELVDQLRRSTLDRSRFRRFVYMHEGMTCFFGNFADVSHVFSIETDDPAVIDALRPEIRRNQQRASYRRLPPYRP